MADVITRFKLETTQYDSKLRDASKELSDYTRKAALAGNEFGKFTQRNIEAARALGTISPSANNAKDKVRELTNAFNDVAKAYNVLTKEQQASDFGKAMSQSLQNLRTQLKDAKKELYDFGEASKGIGGMFGTDKLSGMLQVFGGNVMTKAADAVISLGNEMVGMVQHGIELAKQGEGIRIAFERLGRGDILDGLRQATHGTVSDLELMKAAVKFNDFKLPVEELGTMLAFAQQKAKDTGQSVDYMVDSIVTGLGRKSLMILDNLGLSAAEIKDKMKDTGDMTKAVGAIIREQMAKAGDYVETAADRATAANVSLQNKMEELGRKFAPVEEASNQLWTSMKIGILDIVGGPLARLLNGLTEAGRLKNALDGMNGDGSNGEKRTEKQLRVLREYSGDKQTLYDRQMSRYTTLENNQWKEYNSLKTQREAFRKEAEKRGAREDDIYTFNDYDRKMEEARNKALAYQQMRAEYQKGAQGILKPSKVEIDTKGSEQNALTTTGSNPQQQAQKSVSNALLSYQQSVEKAKMSLDNGTDTEAQYKQKTLAAEEQLWAAYGKAYNTYADPKYKEAQDACAKKIQELGGEVTTAIETQKRTQETAHALEQAQKKLADAQDKASTALASGDLKTYYAAQKQVQSAQTDLTKAQTVTVEVKGAEALEQLKAIEGVHDVKVNVEQGEVNLPSIPTDDETIKVNVEQGEVNLPDIPTEDITQTVTVTVDDAKALEEMTRLNGISITIPTKIDTPKMEPVQIPLSTANLDTFIGKIKEDIATADLGQSVAQSMESLNDAEAIRTILQTALQNGIDTAQFDTTGLMQRLFGGENIDDSTIQAYVDQLNALLAEKIDQTEWPEVMLKFNAQTGDVSKLGKNEDKSEFEGFQKSIQNLNNGINGLSTVGSGLQALGVKMDGDFLAFINGLQGAMSIVQGVIGIITALSVPAEHANTANLGINTGAIIANTAALKTSTVAGFFHFAGGGIVPHAASGLMVPGNDYSDRTPVMVSSGELILNKAQQGNLAAQMEGGNMMQNLHLETEVSGEALRIVLNNNNQRHGYSDVFTFNL